MRLKSRVIFKWFSGKPALARFVWYANGLAFSVLSVVVLKGTETDEGHHFWATIGLLGSGAFGFWFAWEMMQAMLNRRD
jgi:hypothetical protein